MYTHTHAQTQTHTHIHIHTINIHKIFMSVVEQHIHTTKISPVRLELAVLTVYSGTRRFSRMVFCPKIQKPEICFPKRVFSDGYCSRSKQFQNLINSILSWPAGDVCGDKDNIYEKVQVSCLYRASPPLQLNIQLICILH